MKAKITQNIFSFIFLMQTMFAISQTNMAFHNYYETPGLMVNINNKIFFNSISRPKPPLNYYVSPTYFYGTEGDNIIFQKQVLKNEVTTINDMIVTFDKNIVCVGNAHGCDTPGNPTLFIFKTDTMGNTIFNTDLPNGNSYQGFKKVVQYSDSSFFAVSDSFLYHFNKNGIYLSKKSTPVVGNTTMTSKNNHFILASHTTGNYLTEIDSACNTIHQVTIPYSFTKLKLFSNNCIIGLTSLDVICKTDSFFNLIATSQSKQGILQLTDFDISGDTICCSAQDTAHQLAIFKIDTSFVDTSSLKTNYKYILPQKIVGDKSNLYVLSSENDFLSRNPNVNLLSIDKNSSQVNLISDAGVTQSVMDSGYIVVSGSPPVNYLTYYYRVKVTVKNLGTDTLHEFHLNHKPFNPTNCAIDFYYNQLYSGYNLMPSQSVTVTTPFIAAQAFNPIFGTISTTNYTVTIKYPCFWTSAPNNKNDANHLNDDYCAPLSYETIILDVQEYMPLKNIKAIPNPFNESFEISSDNNFILGVEVNSIDGTSVKQLSQLNIQKTTLNLSELANGFYLVKVFLKDGQCQTIKMIKN